jgi:hypothetical protein
MNLLLSLALLFGGYKAGLGEPSANLFDMLAQVGVGLLIAYSVAMSGAVRRESHEASLGYLCGAGAAGLIGVAACIALAEYRKAGHAGLLADLGLTWAVASILILGVVITMLPALTYEWKKAGNA